MEMANIGSANISSIKSKRVVRILEITCRRGNITPLIALPISVNMFLLRSEEFLFKKNV